MTVVQGDVAEAVESAISKFKRGLLTDSRQLEAESFKDLVAFGERAKGTLLKELQQINLKEADSKGGTALLNGLCVALREIDEAAFLAFTETALAGKCHQVNRSVLRSLSRLSTSDFRRVVYEEIEIYEKNTIDERYRATEHVVRWLSKLPKDDLSGITRIFVIDEYSECDYLGLYMPYMSVITVIWWTSAHPYIPVQCCSASATSQRSTMRLGITPSATGKAARIPSRKPKPTTMPIR